jgi:aldehyde:ferredoxin oxidoreductase
MDMAGNILRVDLTKHKVSKEPLRSDLIKEYIGGLGLAARLFYDLVPPMIDPYSPENVVIFAVGPVQGTLIPGSGRGLFASKSPLTNRFFSSNIGGYLGPELKKAGYDVLAITGKSEKPVYIVIDDNKVELKSASGLWGKTAYETRKIIIEELGDPKYQVACIGPAAENLVRFSAILHPLSLESHAAGRGGIASVMASKNLKAIAMRGSMEVKVADKDAIVMFFKEIAEKCRQHPYLPTYGTSASLGRNSRMGCLGTRNWQTEVFENADKISGHTIMPKYKIADRTCASCPMACVKVTKVSEGKYAGTVVKGPEYETLYALGSMVGVDDFGAIAKAAKLCDDYGLDTMSTGVVIAFAMEAYEKGILTKEETDGIELKFGNGDAVVEIVERIAFRKGWLGNLLAEGVARASEVIGCGSQYFAMHFKGLELAGHSPRAVKAWTLGYSVGWRGGSHHDARPHDIEYQKTVEERAFRVDDKPEIIYKTVHRVMIEESLITCRFFGGYYGVLEPSEVHAKILKLVTGIDFSVGDLWRIARRIRTLIRVLEIRDGFSRKDDINAPPPRILYEPIPSGPSKGAYTKPAEFKYMINKFYELAGWDKKTGKPKSEILKELGLDFTIKELRGGES